MTLSDRALQVLRTQLGEREHGGNNRGPAIERYGGAQGEPWCAHLIRWAYEQAAIDLGRDLPFKSTRWGKPIGNAKLLFRRIAGAGTIVHPALIVPGDVVCFHRGRLGARSGHLGVVSTVGWPGGTFGSIEGNVGSYPSTVRVCEHAVTDGWIVGFARIA